METIAYVAINLFALTILFLIYMNMHYLQEKFFFRQRIFISLLTSCALQLVLDSILWVLDGLPGSLARNMVSAVAVIYFVNSAVPFVIWSLYVNYQVYKNEADTKKALIPLAIPAAINALLGIISLTGGYFFYFDANNVYHRGSLFFITPFVWLFYFLYTTIILMVHRKKFEKRHFIPMIIFMFPMLVSGLIQFLFYGVSIMWASLALSIQIVFMGIQNVQLHTDYLTGLHNRRQLDYYLDELIRDKDRDRVIAGIMLDIDSFKQINDELGHAAGDCALLDASHILRISFSKNDLVCRYGGDEFVIILERKSVREIEAAIARFRHNVRDFARKEKRLYNISYSMGYDILKSDSGMTSKDFINHIDALMYEDKIASKSRAGYMTKSVQAEAES